MKSVKASRLRSLVGTLTWMTGIVLWLRAFIAPLWAALASTAGWGGPPEQASVGRAQILHALRWLEAFLKGQRGELWRRIAVAPKTRTGVLQIICDASPWGLGCLLVDRGAIVAWLASEVTTTDESVLGAKKGDCASQAVFEALALLVAMRAWLSQWRDERTVALVRSDSLAALGALNKINGGKDIINKVMREVALDLAEGSYIVDIVGHLPAHLNDLADALSRMAAPGESGKSFPEQLKDIPETKVPARVRPWWRTLGDPT